MIADQKAATGRDVLEPDDVDLQAARDRIDALEECARDLRAIAEEGRLLRGIEAVEPQVAARLPELTERPEPVQNVRYPRLRYTRGTRVLMLVRTSCGIVFAHAESSSMRIDAPSLSPSSTTSSPL